DGALAAAGRERDPPLRPHHSRTKHRAGADGIDPSPGRIPCSGVLDGLSQDQRAVLEARREHARNRLDRGAHPRRRGGRALDQVLMARGTKPAKTKPAGAKLSKAARGELSTLLDFVRYATSRFVEANLAFAHGTTDPVAEAAFLVCEALHLHPDQFETF